MLELTYSIVGCQQFSEGQASGPPWRGRGRGENGREGVYQGVLVGKGKSIRSEGEKRREKGREGMEGGWKKGEKRKRGIKKEGKRKAPHFPDQVYAHVFSDE